MQDGSFGIYTENLNREHTKEKKSNKEPWVGDTNFWVLASASEMMPTPKQIWYWIRDSENNLKVTES